MTMFGSKLMTRHRFSATTNIFCCCVKVKNLFSSMCRMSLASDNIRCKSRFVTLGPLTSQLVCVL